jgi:hypothetical protein
MLLHRDRRVTPQSGKSGPPLRGRPEPSAGGVAALARGTTPRFALLLSSGRLRTILVPQSNPERL